MMDGIHCVGIYTDTLIIGTVAAEFTDDGRYYPCPSSEGRTIKFSDTSRGNVVYYTWNFGDTLSGSENIVEGPNERVVVHKYKYSGTYNVTLIVRDNIGCVDTLFMERYIFIDGPWGDVSYTPLSGCVPLDVFFYPNVENTDSVIVNPNLSIELRQGGDSVNATMLYTYKSVGSYLPYFYIIKWIDSTERCMLEWRGKDTIHVIDISPDFKTDSLYCIGIPVSFKDESVVVPNSYLLDSVRWNFGNGNSATTAIATTKYDSAGVYNVTLSIYAKDCFKDTTLPVNVMPFPELKFYPPNAASCSNLEVEFYTDTLTDLENSRILRYDCTFSDGEKKSGPPISRTFSTTGWYTYEVLLTFTPKNCTNQYNDSIYVDVYIIPVAEFDPTPPAVRMGEQIHFIDKSQQGDGKIISWQWDIGENTHSQEQSPKHTYKTLSGYVMVYLVIEDENGCWDTISHQVLILENLRFPNIMTPQSIRPDGRQYVFRPIAEEGFFTAFDIKIYNRWGMLVWEQSCKEPNCPDYQNDAFWWNGKNRQGQYVSDGVYYWVVYATPMSQTRTFILNGSVTVVSEQK